MLQAGAGGFFPFFFKVGWGPWVRVVGVDATRGERLWRGQWTEAVIGAVGGCSVALLEACLPHLCTDLTLHLCTTR